MQRIQVWLVLLVSAGCQSASLPLVTPPVLAASPEGLTGPKSALNWLKSNWRDLLGEGVARAGTCPGCCPGCIPIGQQFKDRFFSGMGPTDILGSLLPDLDSLIKSINSRSTSGSCLTQAPVQFTIQPFGQTVTMFAQCYDDSIGSGRFLQFGVSGGKTYLYEGAGNGATAAIVTPEGSGQYSVQAWFTVGSVSSSCGAVPGFGSAWDTCSYGVIELTSDQATQHIELAVAGIGFGFCGAQLASDGTNIFATGSTDMGETCDAVQSACLSAADASTAAQCSNAQMMFQLPPLGREMSMRSQAAANGPANNGMVITTWGTSQYPAVPNVVLDGTVSDGVQSALGGPHLPSAGVGKL
jgi:hypothetical protein